MKEKIEDFYIDFNSSNQSLYSEPLSEQKSEPYHSVRRPGSSALGNRGQKREAAARRTEGPSGLHDRVQ